MSFSDILFFILTMAKQTTQKALDKFLPELKTAREMTQQAFSLARQKIKWEAFEELFVKSADASYEEEWERWRGYRVFATDGSTAALPADEELRSAFGELKGSPTARVSLLYDIVNNIIMDARIAPLEEDERTLAGRHLERLEGHPTFNQGHKELVILDRGYISYDILKSLEDKGIRYCVRVQKSFNKEMDKHEAGDFRVRLEAIGREVRVVKFALASGEEEMLATNLEEEEVAAEAFPELYFKRWPVETKYDELKKKMELENFSGLLADNVRQDFFAVMTLNNILASMLREANERVKRERYGKQCKYEYKVNVNQSIGVLKDDLIKVLLTDDSRVASILYDDMIRKMKKRLVPIRKGRDVPRITPPRTTRFHHNHKSNA
jgi:hypothetical protein